MPSLIIAAHNEAAVIGRCLDTVLAGAAPDELEVIVVANGCTDDTAAIASQRRGVTVIDLPQPGKTGALNAGDAAATRFPRIYLDADILLTAEGVRQIARALDGSTGTLAAMPRRELILDRSPILVRAYFAINARLPVYRDALFGRGVIALSELGRARFDVFPDLVADDLFLDSLFRPDEKQQVGDVVSRVQAPTKTADLLRRLVRVRAGNAALRRASAAAAAQAPAVRPANRLSWLRDVVLPRPWLAPAAACYVVLTIAAGLLAQRSLHAGTGHQWGRDESSRQILDAKTGAQ